MKVRELMRALRAFDPDAEVGIQDHDAGELELSAKVASVHPFDPAACEMPRGAGMVKDVEWAGNVRVVIRAG